MIERLRCWRIDPDKDGGLGPAAAVRTDIGQPPACGSIACFGGWVEWHAPFRAQMGLSPDTGEAETEEMHALFGTGRHANIFAIRGWDSAGPADVGFEGTDHELVSHRPRWLIENSEVMA